MASRTKMMTWIKMLAWQDVQSGLEESSDLLDYRDEKGRSLLHLTCAVNLKKKPQLDPEDSIKLAALFIEKGLDHSEAAFNEGEWLATPLWYAISWGENIRLAAYLLEQGCDPNHCLWASVFKNNTEEIRLLIRHDADIDPVYVDGTTPFLTAVKGGRREATATLLELGADVNFQDPKHRTPLHWALRNGADAAMIRLLLEHGARGDIKDSDGRTPSEIMRRKKDPEIRKLGETYFAD